ncbi:DUF4176 domain-containing protein [Leifsonia poae]|uniref:DUF4176 domain-containing protein n=1 Tax=Leifsonia poae TaxID=110933 RepID=UPI003D68153D
MTAEQLEQTVKEAQPTKREFLPLGSIVILRGSVKKLMIVSRASIVEDDFFDYGAFLYPEGMIDSNVAYFNHGDIHRVVFEGYADDDDELALDILNEAYLQFEQGGRVSASGTSDVEPVSSTQDEDPFASVRDLMDDDDA